MSLFNSVENNNVPREQGKCLCQNRGNKYEQELNAKKQRELDTPECYCQNRTLVSNERKFHPDRNNHYAEDLKENFSKIYDEDCCGDEHECCCEKDHMCHCDDNCGDEHECCCGDNCVEDDCCCTEESEYTECTPIKPNLLGSDDIVISLLSSLIRIEEKLDLLLKKIG